MFRAQRAPSISEPPTPPTRRPDGASTHDRPTRPHATILAAGATPHYRPLHQQAWETFSVSWQTDVKMTFHWLREALLTPMRPGSKVVVVSSGAALNGSPLSGEYATP